MSSFEPRREVTDLLRGGAISLALRLVGIGSGTLFTLLVARHFGAEGVGSYAMAMTFFGIATLAARGGLDVVALHLTAGGSEASGTIFGSYRRIVTIVSLASLAIAGAAAFLAPVVTREWFDKPSLGAHIQVVSLGILPFAVLSLNKEILRGFKNILAYALLGSALVPAIASGVLFFVLLFVRVDVLPVAVQVAAIAVVCIVGIAIVMRKRAGAADSSTSAPLGYGELWRRSTPIFTSLMLTSVVAWTDIIVLGYYRSTSEVGTYNVAVKLAAFVSFALVAMNSIVAPKFAEYWAAGNKEALREVSQKTSKLAAAGALPVLVVLVLWPEWCLHIFSEEIVSGAAALIILALAHFGNALAGPVGTFLLMSGRQQKLQYIVLFAALLNVALNLLLVPTHGVTGAAIGTGCALLAWNALTVAYIYRIEGWFPAFVPWNR